MSGGPPGRMTEPRRDAGAWSDDPIAVSAEEAAAHGLTLPQLATVHSVWRAFGSASWDERELARSGGLPADVDALPALTRLGLVTAGDADRLARAAAAVAEQHRSLYARQALAAAAVAGRTEDGVDPVAAAAARLRAAHARAESAAPVFGHGAAEVQAAAHHQVLRAVAAAAGLAAVELPDGWPDAGGLRGCVSAATTLAGADGGGVAAAEIDGTFEIAAETPVDREWEWELARVGRAAGGSEGGRAALAALCAVAQERVLEVARRGGGGR